MREFAGAGFCRGPDIIGAIKLLVATEGAASPGGQISSVEAET